MKKTETRLLAWLVVISILFSFENNLIAQDKEQENLVSLMERKRNNIKKFFLDNKQALITTETENMLTDEQCQKWVGKRSLLQKTFTQLDDCSGDSLHNILFEDGLLIEEGLGDQLFFLGEFKTTNSEIYNGQEKKKVKNLLGMPYKESEMILVYKKKLHPEIAFYEGIKFDESVVLFFEENKLIAIWVSFYMIC